MKLLDLMLAEGIEWPADFGFAAQDAATRILYFYQSRPKPPITSRWVTCIGAIKCVKVLSVLATDWDSCVVTKEQYHNAVIPANKVKYAEPMLKPTPPEHPGVTAFKKWYAETLPVVEAMAAGVAIEQRSGNVWVPKDTDVYNTRGKYRIKPNTININGYDVPEPLLVAPTHGAYLYGVASAGAFSKVQWDDSIMCRKLLVRGMLHTTKEAAEIHSEALASFTTLEV